MKKIFKNPFFMFVLGIIISSSVAYAINANEITYNDTTVDAAIDDLYDKANTKIDIKTILNNKTVFGGQGVSFNGFTVGHKYLSIYISNYWRYGDNHAHISSGAKDINVLVSENTTSTQGVYGLGALLTFEATSTNINLVYESSPNYYKMYFIDITSAE